MAGAQLDLGPGAARWPGTAASPTPRIFPKGADLSQCTNAQIQAAKDNLNNRPRKRLGFRTPNEVMAEIMAADQGGVATIT
jgi:hypothetical protein